MKDQNIVALNGPIPHKYSGLRSSGTSARD